MHVETLHRPGPRWRRALGLARPHRLALAVVLVLTLVLGAANAVEPWLLGRAFDALTGDLRAFGTVVLAFVGLALGRELIGVVTNWLTWRARIAMHQALLDATVTRLQRLPLSYHRRETVGEVMTRVDRGIQGFVAALSELVFNTLPALVYLVVSIVIMLQLDPRLALLVLGFAPLPVVIGALAAPEQVERERDLLERWARIYGRFGEVLHGILTVKSYTMEEVETRRFLASVGAANRVVVRGVARDTLIGGGRNLIVTGARIAALGFGGWLVLKGEITTGTVIAFLGYVGGLFGPVQGLTGIYQTIRRAQVSLDAVFDILDAEEERVEHGRNVALTDVVGAIAFEGVSFRYGDDGPTVLDGIDLQVRPGETVALVGPSGGGKTTMMALLQRLYDTTSGAIRIDGVDLHSVDRRSLRLNIGVVLQDGMLFNDTVAANIAYGRTAASRAEIEAAAQAANAHAFILALPDGYETLVGERGSRLSVGQRQRIAIARALLKDAPILVLDEATSALDAESEAAVQEALDRLAKGRTTFVIAHRLATVVGADRILVLRHGRIAEQGTHLELMARDGYYASLVRNQVRGLSLVA